MHYPLNERPFCIVCLWKIFSRLNPPNRQSILHKLRTLLRGCRGVRLRFVVFRVMGLELGMEVGDGPTRLKSIMPILKQPARDQRSPRCQVACPIVTKLGRKNPWPKCNPLLGSKVMYYRDQLGPTRGQIAQECPMATKFLRKNPWRMCSALMGSKVMQGSTTVKVRSNCSECPMVFGRKNPWPTNRKHNALSGSNVMQVSAGTTGQIA